MAEKFSLTAQLNLQAPKNVKQVLDSIKSQLKSPTVDVKVDGARTAAKEVKQVANATKDLAREAKTAGTNAGSMAKLFGSALKNVLRYDIARRVFYAFAGAVEQGVKDAISFEREMIKISQVSGKTMEQLKGLQKTVTSLATSLGVSSGSLIKVGLILKQTGLSVKDTETAMRALAKTELAPTFDNIADTAETAVAAMNQFSLGASKLEGLLGKINVVAGKFAVEASDIGVAIRRAGGAFKAAGGEVEELIALFTSVRSTTRETAETIATGFRTIFTRLQRPTTIKFLRQFGVELTDLNGKFVGPYEGVKRLSNALQNLDPKDLRFSAIVEQLGGFRQVSKVIPLIQQFGVAQAALNAQLRAGESLTTDAQIAQQSLAVQMQKVTEDVKELFREMTASDGFLVFAKGALALANAMTAVGKAIAPIIPLLVALFAIKGGGFIGGAFKKGGFGGLNKAFGSADGRTSAGMFGGGGKVRGFNRGGWVPGSGSGDTVPAMLQPGEFVVRKSAAQAMGSRMEGVNKYALGGNVKASGQGLRKFSGVGGLFNKYQKKPRDWQHTKNTPWNYNEPQDQFNLDDTFNVTNKPHYIDLSAEEIGAISRKDRLDYKKAGLAGGKAWERILRGSKRLKSVPGKAGKGSSPPLDGYLKGIRGAGDAALTNKSHTGPVIAEKAFRFALLREPEKMLKSYETTKDGEPFNIPMTRVNEFIPSNKTDAEILNTLKRKRKASGGSISGPDTVPALLTPGEFVVNKKSAQAMGYDNLEAVNKYNKGGVVGIAGAAAGGVQGGLIDAVILNAAITGLTSFATQSGLLSEELGAVVSEFGSTIAQVKGINTALASADIGGAKDRKEFGLFSQEKGEDGKRLSIGDAAKGFRERAESQSKAKAELDEFKNGLKSSNEALKAATIARNDANADIRNQKGGPSAGDKDLDDAALEAQKQVVISKKKAAVDQKAVAKAETELKKQDEIIAADNKRIKTSKKMTLALELAGAAAIQFGNSMKDAALKAIEAGDFEGQSTKAAVGGGLATGVQGALIGAQMGGKKGGIWGAVIAGIGGAALAFYNAEKRIKEVKFEKTLEANKENLDLFAKGTISAASGLISLERQIEKREALLGDVDEGTRAKARAAQEAAAETLATGLGKSAVSVEEFDRTIEDNSKTLLRTGSIRQDLIDKIRDEVESRIDSEEKLRAYTEAQREATNELLRLKGISAVTNELRGDIKTSANIVSGVGTSGIGPIGQAGSALNAQPRSKAGIKRFEDAIDSIGRSGKSAGLGEFGERVKGGAAVERELEGVLLNAARVNPVGRESVEEAIIEELKGKIGKAAALAVGDDISAALDNIDITNLDEQHDEIAEAIKGATSRTREAYVAQAALIDERNAFLKNSYAQLQTVENSYIAAIGKTKKARVQEEQNYLKNINVSALGPESDKDVQARFFTRLNDLAKPGKGIKGTDVAVNDIDALGKKLLELQNEQIKNNKLLAEPNNADIEGREDLIQSSYKLKREFDAVKSILNEYGNSQQRLIALNDKLARAKQQQETLKNSADKLIFGTADDKNAAAKFINSISKALNEGTVMGIAPELRLAVVEAFKSGQFGQEGEDILNRDRANAVGRVGIKDTGVLGRASKDVRETAAEIKAVENATTRAMNALAEVEGARVESMASTIETQNNEFLKRLESLFHEERLRQVEIEQNTQQKIVDELAKTQSLLKENNVTTEEQFKVLKSPQAMKDVDTLRRLRDRKKPKLEAAEFSDYAGNEIEDFLDAYEMTFIPGTGRNTGRMPVTGRGDVATSLDTFTGGKDAYRPALDAVRAVMTATGVKNLNTRVAETTWDENSSSDITGYRGATVAESGLGGQNVRDSLFKYADENFTDGAEKTFNAAMSRILDNTGGYASVAVQDIAKAIKIAQDTTTEKIDKFEANKPIAAIANIPKAIADDLAARVTGITSLNALNIKYDEAATVLGNINAKLKMIEGLDPRRKEKDAAAAKVTSQRASIAQGRRPIGSTTGAYGGTRPNKEFTGSINNPAQIAAFNAEKAQGISAAENRTRDEAARDERIRKATGGQPAPAPASGQGGEFKYDPDGPYGSLGGVIQKQKQREAWKREQKIKQLPSGIPGEPRSGTFKQGKLQSSIKPFSASDPLAPMTNDAFERKPGMTYSGGEATVPGMGTFNAQGEGTGAFKGFSRDPDLYNKPNTSYSGVKGGQGGAAVEDVDTGISLIKHTVTNGEALERQEGTLTEMLAVIKGNQEGSAAAAGGQESSNQIDTAALDKSFNTFSTAVSDLERVMSGPITMEVGGEIEINVNLSGAEALQESEAAFAKIAGSKVTDGINNFIRNGLRSSSIAIKGDWTA